MDFQPIFGQDIDCKIWTMVDIHKNVNCFKFFIDQLRDDSYIFNYLHEREEFINSEFWGGINLDRLYNQIKLETKQLISDVIGLATGKYDNDLRDLFVPLDKNEFSMSNFFRHSRKAKFYTTHRTTPVLRLYGIELEDETIVLTGGGIKLTKTMSEDNALQKELIKIKKVQTFINENKIISKSGLI